MTKVCVKCGEEKPETKVFFRPNPIRGLRNDCRDCEAKYRKAAYYKDPEKFAAASRKWCRENKEKHNATKRKWVRSNLDKHNATRRKSLYGISDEEFQSLLISQNGKCAICSFEFPGVNTGDRLMSPHVDHCHKSGKVRGLLCRACNNGIGHFKDSFDLFQKAIQYLQKNS